MAIDPALGYDTNTFAVENATCALLLRHPDRNPPAGLAIVPETARAWPRVSSNGKRYTFVIRRGLRFSDGSPLTARNYVHAIARLRDPAMDSPAMVFGQAEPIAAVHGSGRRLVITLKRSTPDFPARLATPLFCPVPANLPSDPEGVRPPLPAAGPYFIQRGERDKFLVLARNRFYRGSRPQRFERFVFRLDQLADDATTDVVTNREDWTSLVDPHRFGELRRRYGLNRSRYFVAPGLDARLLPLNTERPLFRRAAVRRAVNYAIDRRALVGVLGPGAAGATDQYLPPVMPGFRDARIYPLERPDLRRARALVGGRVRNGRAVLYAPMGPGPSALAQSVKSDLAKIGIAVEIKSFPLGVVLAKLGTRGEPWDIGLIRWVPDWVDAFSFLDPLFDGRWLHATGTSSNFSYVDSPSLNRALARAARFRGRARARAFGKLDVEVSRKVAPYVPWAYSYDHVLVSRRIGCVVMDPYAHGLDLAAACIRR